MSKNLLTKTHKEMKKFHIDNILINYRIKKSLENII